MQPCGLRQSRWTVAARLKSNWDAPGKGPRAARVGFIEWAQKSLVADTDVVLRLARDVEGSGG